MSFEGAVSDGPWTATSFGVMYVFGEQRSVNQSRIDGDQVMVAG